MIAFIEIDDLKTHLNIDKDFTDDDQYLLDLWDTAVLSIERYIDCDINAFMDDGVLEAPLNHAAKLLVGTWYQNRESVAYGTPNKIPHTLEYLLQSYVNYFDNKNSNCCCK